MYVQTGAYLPLGHLGHATPFELQNNIAYGKKCNQNAPFSGKNLKNFLGRGHSPFPRPYLLQFKGGGAWPTREENTPDQTPRLGRRSPRPPPIFFPISIITLDTGAVIDEFGKSNRRLVLLVDLGILNGTRLEVGPVNIQSSH